MVVVCDNFVKKIEVINELRFEENNNKNEGGALCV